MSDPRFVPSFDLAHREAEQQFGPLTSWSIIDHHAALVPVDGYCGLTVAIELGMPGDLVLSFIVRFNVDDPTDCYLDEFELLLRAEARRRVTWSRDNEP